MQTLVDLAYLPLTEWQDHAREFVPTNGQISSRIARSPSIMSAQQAVVSILSVES